MPKQPDIGVRLVADNEHKATRALDKFDRAVERVGKKLEGQARKAKESSGAFGKFDSIVEKVTNRFKGAGVAAGALSKALAGIPAVAAAATAAVAALVAGIVALIKLGQRGAALRGISESFDNLTRSIGLASDALLNRLSKAAAGTIADFRLMTTANKALAGAVGEFGQRFGNALPRLLEIARTQARATGQSVAFLFQSLTDGIKRNTPLLIDNTGLVLKVGEANRRYAESVGKTVQELTAQERQIALLQATMQAGNRAIEAAGNIAETAAEKQQRAQAKISNILDQIGVAIQPAWEAVLDVINRVLTAIQHLVDAATPWLRAIASIVETALQKFLGLTQGIESIDWDRIARGLFIGATRMAGSLIRPIVTAATRIQEIVIQIATHIANFLTGFSPPKEGPLKHIDKGARRMMEAWITGFTGVGTEPVRKIAQDVQDILIGGGVANLGRGAVEQRIKQLDQALQPFADRLKIVKSRFEAIAEPARAALDAIDRQTQRALDALFRGEKGSSAVVRRLDRQRTAIQRTVDSQQALLDQEQIRVALIKSQQAEERTLLEIRKRQLGPEIKRTKVAVQAANAVSRATGRATGKTKRKATGGTGGPAGIDLGDAAGGAAQPSSEENIPGFLQFTTEMRGPLQREALRRQLDTAFGDASGLTAYKAGQERLQTQIGRIQGAVGEGTLGSEIASSIGGFLFDVDNPKSLAGRFHNFFNGDGPGTLGGAIGDIEKWWNENVSSRISNAWSSLFDINHPGGVANRIHNFFTGEGEGTLRGIISSINLTNILNLLPGGDLVGQLFGNLINWIKGKTDPLTGETTGGLPLLMSDLVGWFRDLPGSLANVFLSNIPGGDLVRSIFGNIIDWVFGGGDDEGRSGLPGLIDRIVSFFRDIPTRIVDALQGIASLFWNLFVPPMVRTINALIDIINSFFQNPFVQTALDAIASIGAGLAGVATPGAPTIRIEHIQMPANPFARRGGGVGAFGTSSVPGAAHGGLFTRGLVRVGEDGEELVGAASKIGVLPNRLTQVFDRLEAMLAPPPAMPIPLAEGATTNTTTTIENSMVNHFNGVQDSTMTRRHLNTLRAFRS